MRDVELTPAEELLHMQSTALCTSIIFGKYQVTISIIVIRVVYCLSSKHSFGLFFFSLPVSDHERVQSESCLLKASSDKMNGY